MICTTYFLTFFSELIPPTGIDYIIEVINGRPVNNEIKNYREISIFKTGVTL
jgi:altronate dehydratase